MYFSFIISSRYTHGWIYYHRAATFHGSIFLRNNFFPSYLLSFQTSLQLCFLLLQMVFTFRVTFLQDIDRVWFLKASVKWSKFITHRFYFFFVFCFSVLFFFFNKNSTVPRFPANLLPRDMPSICLYLHSLPSAADAIFLDCLWSSSTFALQIGTKTKVGMKSGSVLQVRKCYICFVSLNGFLFHHQNLLPQRVKTS